MPVQHSTKKRDSSEMDALIPGIGPIEVTPKRQCPPRNLFRSNSDNSINKENNKMLTTLLSKFDNFTSEIREKVAVVKSIAEKNSSDIEKIQLRLGDIEQNPSFNSVSEAAAANSRAIEDLTSRLAAVETNKSATVPVELPQELSNRIVALETRSEHSERLQRESEIVISNLIIKKGDAINCREVFNKIVGYLKLKIESTDIAYCRILNKERKGKPGSSQELHGDWNYLDFLVKLKSNDLKTTIMTAYYHDLKLNNQIIGTSELGHRIYMNDNLTRESFKIFKEAKSLFKIKNDSLAKIVESVFSSHGIIYVKKLDFTVLRIDSLQELNEIAKTILNPEPADTKSSSETE